MKEEEKRELIQNSKNNPVMLGIFLLEEQLGVIRSSNGLYFYNGKCYDLLNDGKLDTVFQDFCIKWGITKSFEKVGMVTRAMRSYSKIKDVPILNDYEGLLCLNNGILNVYTSELIPHSKDYYFDSVINVDYDESAGDCSSFMAYLDHTFNGDHDTITNIIRLGGYLLDTSCAAKKMFMFDGNGGSGKSTLIDTYSMFFIESQDEKNQVTGLTLEELAKPGFDNEILLTSRFNPCAETKKGWIDAEEIKKIVSGDVTKISRKYEKAINFRPKTKIVVACNGLPRFTDTSDGIYRRLCIIPFKNQYKSPSDYAKIKDPESRRIYVWDNTLFDKIKSEKSAILNLFISGLLDLKQEKYEFVDSADSTKAIIEFKRDSDTVREFLEDNYEMDMGSQTPLKEVFENFRLWYMENVQETRAMRFRSAEMGKRIKEVFGIESRGQMKWFNAKDQKYEMLTWYPLKPKVIEADVEEIMTPDQATQRGLNF